MQLGEKEERTRARPAHIWCPTHPTAGDKRATRSLVGVTDRQTRWGAHTPHTTTPTARIGFFSLSLFFPLSLCPSPSGYTAPTSLRTGTGWAAWSVEVWGRVSTTRGPEGVRVVVVAIWCEEGGWGAGERVEVVGEGPSHHPSSLFFFSSCCCCCFWLFFQGASSTRPGSLPNLVSQPLPAWAKPPSLGLGGAGVKGGPCARRTPFPPPRAQQPPVGACARGPPPPLPRAARDPGPPPGTPIPRHRASGWSSRPVQWSDQCDVAPSPQGARFKGGGCLSQSTPLLPLTARSHPPPPPLLAPSGSVPASSPPLPTPCPTPTTRNMTSTSSPRMRARR